MATVHYPGAPGTMLYGGRAAAASGAGVATTISVANTSGGALSTAPATFGHSFPPGAWQPSTHDLHAAAAGAPLTIQTDAVSLHPDGSVRFAVVSIDAGAMSAGQTKTIDLTTGTKRAAYGATLTSPPVNLVAEATIYGVQRTEVICSKGGPAFVEGEAVTLRLTAAGTNYDYTTTVAAGRTGGTDVADALSTLVNAGGMFRARREGEGGGYERITVELVDPLAGGFTASAIYAGPANIVFKTISSFAAPVVWTAALQSVLDSQVAESNAGTINPTLRRLHGPVVSEFRQSVKFKDPGGVEHAFLTAIFDTRIYADGRQWVDVTLENTGLMAANPLAINYKLDIKVGGATVFSQPRFWHFSKARWHKAVWMGGNPSLRVTRDMAYHMTTRSMPNYALNAGASGAELGQYVTDEATAAANKSYYGPMACTLLLEEMGTTGGRPEIGLISQWVYDYYATQDDRARALMLKVVDNASGFSIHFRDEATGFPAGMDTRSDLEVGPYYPSVPVSSEMVPGVADTAHEGTFSYHPYLITGDAYHLDEMMFWASYDLAKGNRSYRFAAGVGNLMDEQTRGMAWGIRTVAEVCYALPYNHPRRQYYRDQLAANLARMSAVKGASWANGPFGCVTIDTGWGGWRADNWQCDFLMAVLGWLAENGEANSAGIITHLAQYQFGRVLHEADGVCPQWANAYYAPVRVGGYGAWVTTWNEYAQLVGGADYGKTCSTLPIEGGAAGDYAAVLRAAIASCANSGDATAVSAAAVWESLIPNAAGDNRKWAIVRRV